METKLRKQAQQIFRAALEAADPVKAVLRNVACNDDKLIVGRRHYRFEKYDRFVVVGAGKASASMARGLEKLLGKRIESGLVNVKYGHLAKLRHIQLNECGHPVPDDAGVEGARKIARIAASAGERDLVLCVISGGGSALMPMPAAKIRLEEKQETTRQLLACGASIHEINTIRKHISGIKGGQLSRLAYPGTVVSLMLSDVIGDDLDVIASGPTAPDHSTFADAQKILEDYGILRKVPGAVRVRIAQGVHGKIEETPKEGAPEFGRTQNLVVGSNCLAVDAAVKCAKELGFHPLVLSTFVEGETRDVGRFHSAIAKEIHASSRPLGVPACVISGGETTVTIRGKGLGGRNQEFVLAAAIDIAGLPNTVVLSGGTDGTDGPTDAAGAIADGETMARADKAGLDAPAYLAANNSYRFFDPLGDLLKTGPTNTNVMDIRLLLVGTGED